MLSAVFYEAGYCQGSHFILLLYKNGHSGQINAWMIKDTNKATKHSHILTVLFLTSLLHEPGNKLRCRKKVLFNRKSDLISRNVNILEG